MNETNAHTMTAVREHQAYVRTRVVCPQCGHFLGLAGAAPDFDPWCGRCKKIISLVLPQHA